MRPPAITLSGETPDRSRIDQLLREDAILVFEDCDFSGRTKAMREVARFRSRRFVPVLPDASQVEPGVYGVELAFWLAGKLARQGIVTRYPVAGEDCWCLECAVEAGAAFRVLCANVAGSDAHWRIALMGEGPASFGQAQPLVNAIRFVLHAGVPREDIDWRYEVDQPPRGASGG